MERKIYKELIKEVDSRTVKVFERMNQSIANPNDLELRIEVVKELALNIQANQKMLHLVDQLIKDNETSTKVGLLTKLKNVYYLVKINNYYIATNEELLKTAFEHDFAIKGSEK